MKRNQAIILAVCGVILFGLVLMYLLDRPPTPAALARRTLSASTPEERQHAILQLIQMIQMRGPEILPYLQNLVVESQDPDVVYTAINGIDRYHDPANIRILIDAMNHPSEMVRERASYVVLKILGRGEPPVLPEGLQYNPSDDNSTSEERQMVVRRLKEIVAEKEKEADKVTKEKHEKSKDTYEQKK